MKIRNGFVSNSSSSSFICDVCGEIESGYDLCLSDLEMATCNYGHLFHESEMVPLTAENFSLDTEIQYLKLEVDRGQDRKAQVLKEVEDAVVNEDGLYEYVSYRGETTFITKEELLNNKSINWITTRLTSNEELLTKLEEFNGAGGYEKFKEALEEIEDYDYSPTAAFLENEEAHCLAVQCPVCSMEHISSTDLVNYMFKKSGITKLELEKEIKEKFNTYIELTNFNNKG